MRLSLHWLNDFDLHAAPETLAHTLTMAGLEVDSTDAAAPPFSGVVVGQVLTLTPHPDADKLRVATVDVGQDQPLQIVCGASNCAVGIKVPTALVGAQLPGDLKIKKSKLRGVESLGMLCSARELGLSEDHSGLWLLPTEAPVGQNLRDYLALEDAILDIDLTPNRADAFSMRGLAREIGVLTQQSPQFLTLAEVTGSGAFPLTLENQTPEDAPYYWAREIRGLNPEAATPLWLTERLRRAGIRPHSALVDVTNYVMLCLGTPMHAFDRAQIVDKLVIRRATVDEKLTLLNGQTVTLSPKDLLIADAQKALALAGVMGGLESAVSATTTSVILEAAWFCPVTIAGRARAFGLASDSAQRFERGVDFTLQKQALDYATHLILDICGGEAGCAVNTTAAAYLPQRAPVALRRASFSKRIGRDYDDATITRILTALGCTLEATSEGWQAVPPPWRFDLALEVDFIEEVARVEGYDKVTDVPPAAVAHCPALDALALHRETLASLGFYEAITYAFLDPEVQAVFYPETPGIALQNPISATLAEMRRSLVPGLVQTALYNRNRQQQDLRLFELGKVFIPQGAHAREALQEEHLAGVLCGRAQPEQWGVSARLVDFYDAKAAVAALLPAAEYRPSTCAFLHPGQGADVYLNGALVGFVGALHPQVQKTLGIKGSPLLVFELKAAALPSPKLSPFVPIGKFPVVRRDLALVLDRATPAATIQQFIVQNVRDVACQCFVFDCFEDEKLGCDKKSLAVAILLSSEARTLQDEEVERMISDLFDKLTHSFNAQLR